MHDEALEYRIEQVEVTAASRLSGRTLHEAALRETTGVQLLAIRWEPKGPFVPNPAPGVRIEPGTILIAVGTPGQLATLHEEAGQG
jgi:voltage-gated potassium channel